MSDCFSIGFSQAEVARQRAELEPLGIAIEPNPNKNGYCWYKRGDEFLRAVESPPPYFFGEGRTIPHTSYLYFSSGRTKKVPDDFGGEYASAPLPDTVSFYSANLMNDFGFVATNILSDGANSLVYHYLPLMLDVPEATAAKERKIKASTNILTSVNDGPSFQTYVAGYDWKPPLVVDESKPEIIPDGKNCPELLANSAETVKGAISLDGWELMPDDTKGEFIALPRHGLVSEKRAYAGAVEELKLDLRRKLIKYLESIEDERFIRYFNEIEFLDAYGTGELACPRFKVKIIEKPKPPPPLYPPPGGPSSPVKPKLSDKEYLERRYAKDPKLLIKVRSGLILGNVRAVGTGGGKALDLPKQVAEAFREEVPVDKKEGIIAGDITGSMSAHLTELAKHSDEVMAVMKASAKESSLGLATFSDDHILLRHPINTFGSIEMDVSEVTYQLGVATQTVGGGYEYIADTVRLCLQEFKEHGSQGAKKKIVVITDEKGDIKTDKPYSSIEEYERLVNAEFEKVRKEADAMGVEIEVIFIMDEAMSLFQKDVFQYFEDNKIPYGTMTHQERIDLLLGLFSTGSNSMEVSGSASMELQRQINSEADRVYVMQRILSWLNNKVSMYWSHPLELFGNIVNASEKDAVYKAFSSSGLRAHEPQMFSILLSLDRELAIRFATEKIRADHKMDSPDANESEYHARSIINAVYEMVEKVKDDDKKKELPIDILKRIIGRGPNVGIRSVLIYKLAHDYNIPSSVFGESRPIKDGTSDEKRVSEAYYRAEASIADGEAALRLLERDCNNENFVGSLDEEMLKVIEISGVEISSERYEVIKKCYNRSMIPAWWFEKLRNKACTADSIDERLKAEVVMAEEFLAIARCGTAEALTALGKKAFKKSKNINNNAFDALLTMDGMFISHYPYRVLAMMDVDDSTSQTCGLATSTIDKMMDVVVKDGSDYAVSMLKKYLLSRNIFLAARCAYALEKLGIMPDKDFKQVILSEISTTKIDGNLEAAAGCALHFKFDGTREVLVDRLERISVERQAPNYDASGNWYLTSLLLAYLGPFGNSSDMELVTRFLDDSIQSLQMTARNTLIMLQERGLMDNDDGGL